MKTKTPNENKSFCNIEKQISTLLDDDFNENYLKVLKDCKAETDNVMSLYNLGPLEQQLYDDIHQKFESIERELTTILINRKPENEEAGFKSVSKNEIDYTNLSDAEFISTLGLLIKEESLKHHVQVFEYEFGDIYEEFISTRRNADGIKYETFIKIQKEADDAIEQQFSLLKQNAGFDNFNIHILYFQTGFVVVYNYKKSFAMYSMYNFDKKILKFIQNNTKDIPSNHVAYKIELIAQIASILKWGHTQTEPSQEILLDLIKNSVNEIKNVARTINAINTNDWGSEQETVIDAMIKSIKTPMKCEINFHSLF